MSELCPSRFATEVVKGMLVQAQKRLELLGEPHSPLRSFGQQLELVRQGTTSSNC